MLLETLNAEFDKSIVICTFFVPKGTVPRFVQVMKHYGIKFRYQMSGNGHHYYQVYCRRSQCIPNSRLNLVTKHTNAKWYPESRFAADHTRRVFNMSNYS